MMIKKFIICMLLIGVTTLTLSDSYVRQPEMKPFVISNLSEEEVIELLKDCGYTIPNMENCDFFQTEITDTSNKLVSNHGFYMITADFQVDNNNQPVSPDKLIFHSLP